VSVRILFLGLTDYEQAFESADKKVLVKVLSLCGIPYEHIKVISVIYETYIAATEMGREG